jgi:hypothetical protein
MKLDSGISRGLVVGTARPDLRTGHFDHRARATQEKRLAGRLQVRATSLKLINKFLYKGRAAVLVERDRTQLAGAAFL